MTDANRSHANSRRQPIRFSRLQSVCVAWFVAIMVPDWVHAKPPEIRSVNVRGLQIGQPTVVTIDGIDLLPNLQPAHVQTANLRRQTVE